MRDVCSNITLAAGATCEVDVRFTPQSLGGKSATLSVSASPGGTANAALTGTGVSLADISISPTPFDFGGWVIGEPSTTQSFTVTNNGGVPTGALTVTLGGTNAGEFAILTNNCQGAVVAAAGTCIMTARFTPTSQGSKQATITVSGLPGGTTVGTLVGLGQTEAVLTIEPTSQDFGSVEVGSSSDEDVVFTVSNTGDVASGVVTTSLGGTNPGDFIIVADTCNGNTVAGHSSCTMTVRFTPLDRLARSATLTAAGTPGGAPVATLTGIGLTPAGLTQTPPTIDFGTVPVGDASGEYTITVTNNGDVPTSLISTTISGTWAGDFSVTIDNCVGFPLAAGASCTIRLIFAPALIGPAARTATFTTSATIGGTVSTSLIGDRDRERPGHLVPHPARHRPRPARAAPTPSTSTAAERSR